MATLTFDETCTSDDMAIVRNIFNRIGDKWTLVVIRMLEGGPQRFTGSGPQCRASPNGC